MKKIYKFFLFIFAFIGAFFTIGFVSYVTYLNINAKKSFTIPDKMALYIDLDEKISETVPETVLGTIAFRNNLTVSDFLKAIEFAKTDEKVKILVARISSSELGLGQADEIRKAIIDFKSSGKKAIIYSPSFGFLGSGLVEYYIATAFDEIWLQPTGELGISGISIEIPFIKDTLDKIGIKPSFYKRYEYKTAPNSFTQNSFTKEHKESITKLTQSLYKNIVGDISKQRKIANKKIDELVNKSPLFSKESLENKLIDKVKYSHNLDDFIKEELEAELFDIKSYSSFLSYKNKKGAPAIALIRGDGAITSGYSFYSPANERSTIGARSVITAIRTASNNKNIKAIVVRFNSPGGEYIPSDAIREEIRRAVEDKNKIVVFSMGDFCASGCYFIASQSEYIFADKNTITASIGVFGGKMVIKEFWDKIGVNWEQVKKGENAGLTSPNRDFSQKQKQAFQKSLDFIYDDFTKKVANSRNIKLKELDKLARGRVFTGNIAKEKKLIDEIGGLKEALLYAKQKAKIKDEFRMIIYPRLKTPEELIIDFIENKDTSRGLKELEEAKTQIKHNPFEIKLLRQIKEVISYKGALHMPFMKIK